MSGHTDAFSLAKSHTSGPPQGPLPNRGDQTIVNLTGKPFHITGTQPFRDRLQAPPLPDQKAMLTAIDPLMAVQPGP